MRSQVRQPKTWGAVHEVVARRVYREFLEMPDLRVNLGDAQRLFGLAETECAMVLDCLAEFGLLARVPGGRYMRRAE